MLHQARRNNEGLGVSGALIVLDELRHFSLAAERCNVTQSALSRSIQALEQELDVRLVDRDGKRNTLTAYGALVRLDISGRDTLAIYGQGPVGLSATLLGKAMGARVIAAASTAAESQVANRQSLSWLRVGRISFAASETSRLSTTWFSCT